MQPLIRKVAWALAGILLGTVTVVAQSDRRLARSAAGESGRRVAFVVGNNRYPESPLKNAVADAAAMASVLEGELGFHVTRVTDAGLDVLETALDRFVNSVNPGDLALFYYAGHAYEIKGENYLLPVDFRADQEAQVKRRALSAAEVEERLAERGARVRLMILDACRNNPYGANRSGAGGMAPMSPQGALVLFATAPRQTAADNPDGSNGLFTQELLKALRVPGLQISDLVRRVRQGVYAASNGRQVPWYHDGLIGDLVLRPTIGTSSAPAAALEPVPAPAPRIDERTVDRTDPDRVLALDEDAAVITTLIKKDQVSAFDRVLARLRDGLRQSRNPLRRAQAEGWRVYKAVKDVQDNAAYVMYLSPAIKGAEYDIVRLLEEEFPTEVRDLYEAYRNAFAGRGIARLSKVHIEGLGGGSRDPISDPPEITSSGATPVLSLAGDAAAITIRIRAGHEADFEDVLAYAARSLNSASDPALKRQASNWNVFKGTQAVDGNTVYLLFVHSTNPRLEYDLTSIIGRRFPDEVAAVFEKYKAAFVGRGVTELRHFIDMRR